MDVLFAQLFLKLSYPLFWTFGCNSLACVTALFCHSMHNCNYLNNISSLWAGFMAYLKMRQAGLIGSLYEQESMGLLYFWSLT